MKKVILLVLTEDDVKAIPSAVQSLKSQKPEGIWIIHNPQLGVTNESALLEIEKDIASINAQKAAAEKREDYTAAQQFKERRDAKQIERDLAIRQGWQKVTAEQRQRSYDAMFKDFNGECADNIMVTTLRESWRPEQTPEMLHSLASVWPKPLAHGSYVLAWPGSLNGSKIETPREGFYDKETDKAAAIRLANIAKPSDLDPLVDIEPLSRREQLKKMRFGGVRTKAKKLGVYREGIKFEEMIDAVLAKEEELTKPFVEA